MTFYCEISHRDDCTCGHVIVLMITIDLSGGSIASHSLCPFMKCSY